MSKRIEGMLSLLSNNCLMVVEAREGPNQLGRPDQENIREDDGNPIY